MACNMLCAQGYYNSSDMNGNCVCKQKDINCNMLCDEGFHTGIDKSGNCICRPNGIACAFLCPQGTHHANGDGCAKCIPNNVSQPVGNYNSNSNQSQLVILPQSTSYINYIIVLLLFIIIMIIIFYMKVM